MHDVSNLFEFNFFQRKQCFSKLCPFGHFLSTCYHVALRKSPNFFSNKVQVDLPLFKFYMMPFSFGYKWFSKNGHQTLVVINICNYLIFIASFLDRHVIVVTGLIGPLRWIVYSLSSLLNDMLICYSLFETIK